MVWIQSSIYHVWPNFSIHVPRIINFQECSHYHLHGENGSGKSSFITQILIPTALEQKNNLITLFIDYQNRLQFNTIRADSFLRKYPLPIDDITDTIHYLLSELKSILSTCKKDVLIIIDEIPNIDILTDFISSNQSLKVCVVQTLHGNLIPISDMKLRTLEMALLSPLAAQIIET